MTIDDVDYNAYSGLKSNDVQSDAIGFIIYGSFPLTTVAEGRGVGGDWRKHFRRSILTGASSLLTGTLSEFLRTQTGFISSVELNFNATSRASGIGRHPAERTGVERILAVRRADSR